MDPVMRVTRRQFTAAAASLLAFTPVGCATLSDKSDKSESSFVDRLPWNKNKKDEVPEPYPNPVKLAATWTPDSLVQTGRIPTRGFGGRVFFYDEKSRPVPVDGTLIVHGFDETESSSEPEMKRFEFTPEQFTRHFSQSDLGASYSVWIPWDAMGGLQRRISLVASFKTAEGKVVQGIPATIMLPGTAPELGESDAIAQLAPQYQRYLKATQSGSARTSGLTTTTIPRRRSSRLPGETTRPGIAIPTLQKPGDMIANGNLTPAVDLDMKAKVRRSVMPKMPVMPASARMPIQR
jgi:hypothetical protein